MCVWVWIYNNFIPNGIWNDIECNGEFGRMQYARTCIIMWEMFCQIYGTQMTRMLRNADLHGFFLDVRTCVLAMTVVFILQNKSSYNIS